MPAQKSIKLLDYIEYPFLIPSINLDFNIRDDYVLVEALMLIKPSNFLLLDEPTNHLDLQSKENLESALKKYKGTLLVISHDRYFISRIANKIVEIDNSQINSFNGNYEYYLHKKQN